MTKEQKRDIILKLKAYREENEISIEKAYAMVEEAGEISSVATAQRIFAKGSEDAANFRYDSLKPYIKVFFGTETPTPAREEGNEEQAQQYFAELEGIKSVLAFKNAEIERLEKENAELRERMSEAKAESDRKVEYLKQRVEDCKYVYHREETRQEHTIKILRRSLFGVSLVLGVMVFLVIGILIYDLTNRDVGWFREIAAHFSETAGMYL